MRKYSNKLKREIIQRAMSGDGHYELAKEYGLNKRDVQRWVAAYRYHSEASF